jgi:hypothetical protein
MVPQNAQKIAMQPNIVWSQVASRKGLQANGLDTCWKYMQTKHLEMSKSLPAMVETAVSKVSTFFQWCDLWLSLVRPLAQPGATFGSWCDLWLSLVRPLAQPGATFGSA